MKYTTLKDVKDTVKKLERLFKTKNIHTKGYGNRNDFKGRLEAMYNIEKQSIKAKIFLQDLN